MANRTHIAPISFLISHHARAADDFQVVNVRETRQEIVLNPGSEFGIFFVVTDVLERQHGDALWIYRGTSVRTNAEGLEDHNRAQQKNN